MNNETLLSDPETIFALLDEQYVKLERYCNAKIALHNALVVCGVGDGGVSNQKKRHEVLEAMEEYQDATQSIQELWGKVTEMKMLVSKEKQSHQILLLEQYSDRVQRILDTVGQPLVHENGVLVVEGIDQDMLTQSLSTLRASIRVIKEACGGG